MTKRSSTPAPSAEHLADAEKLVRSYERLTLATNAARVGIWDWDIRKNVLVWDDRMFELYGMKRSEFGGAYEAWLAGIHPDDRAACDELTRRVLKGEAEYDTQFRVVWPDGSVRVLRAHAIVIRDQAGTPVRETGVNFDITERETTIALLRLLSAKNDLHGLMKTLTLFLKELSGCEAIGIRIRDGEDFPYYETRGFPTEFVEAERSLCTRNLDGQIARDAIGNPVIECMCGNIICERFDPSKPFFTQRGSFWSNGTTELLASTTDANRQARTRNRCNGEGYESVALVALRAGGDTFGLIQLNDRRKNRFTLPFIQQIETLADSIAIALLQRQSNKALGESEERYRQIVTTANEGVFTLDTEMRFTYVNSQLAEGLGYPVETLIGMAATEVIAPDHLADHAMQVSLRKNGQKGAYERRMIKKDGGEVWVSVSVAPILGDDGAFNGALGLVTDITERKRAEVFTKLSTNVLETLNRSDDFSVVSYEILHIIKSQAGFDAVGIRLHDADDFPYLVQNGFSEEFMAKENNLCCRTPDGSAVADDSGCPILECTCGLVLSGKTDPANPLFTKGGSAWTNESSVLLDIPESIDPRLHPRNTCVHQGYASVALVPIRVEQRIVGLLQLNDRRPNRFTLQTVEFFESIATSIGVALIKQEHLRAMRENEEKYTNLFKNSEVGMFRTRLDGSEILDFNHKYLEIFGYTAAEMKKSMAAMHWAEPAERSEMVRLIMEKGQVTNFECRMLTKNGDVRSCLTSAKLFRDKGILEGSLIDLTEKQQLIEAAQRADKLESLSILAGGIAHDFNNLLGALFGYMDMAKESCKSGDRAIGYIDKAFTSFNRAKDLTQQLLTFSKGGAPTRKTCSIAPLVRDSTHFALSGSTVACTFDIAVDLWACDVDENQIGQVIDNLVINAQQAMPKGGDLAVSARNIVVGSNEVPGLDKGNFVKISVVDTGVGIPAANLSKIFDPFFTTKQKGNGLGLATVFSIVRKHEGTVIVESILDKGSAFHVFLPASNGRPGGLSAPGAVQHQGGGRVLIMDDEDAICETVGDMLGSMGYNVVSARNGQEALVLFKVARAAEKPFNALIMDLTIPGGMGGREAVGELRKIDSTVVAIVSSGYSEDEVMSDPAKFGFTDKIKKPFRRVELGEVLERCLSKKG